MNENSWAEARESLLAANQIMIVSHTRPDGDAIGSMLGLGLALKNAGKDVQYAMRDGVPGRFHYIKDSELVENHLEPGYDLLVVVDCSDLERPGFDFGGMIPDINFDHHISNTNFARINIVDAEETAAAALLAITWINWAWN